MVIAFSIDRDEVFGDTIEGGANLSALLSHILFEDHEFHGKIMKLAFALCERLEVLLYGVLGMSPNSAYRL